MPSQPTRSRTGCGPGYADSLPRRDWDLLVGLPARVVAAVRALDLDPDRPTVPEALVAMETIASGRRQRGRLLPEVVAAIYAADEDTAGPEPVSVSAVLDACAEAGEVLAARVPTAEAAAYRRWLMAVATATGRRGGAGGHPATGHPVGVAQLRLLDEIERGLAG